MNILHIETATSVCSVALSIDGVLRTYIDQHEPNIHASKLTVFISDILSQANCKMEDLDAIAISKGPGSYTGLRIGVSAAKGICFALDIPLISIDTLDAMCTGFLSDFNQGAETNQLFCPMIDARRMEVYSAIYNAGKEQIKPVDARIIDAHSFDPLTENGQKVLLFGDGADKFSSLFEKNAQVEVVNGFLNSSRFLINEANVKFQQKQFENVAYFEPFYLKDFVPTTPKRRIQTQSNL
ncbi:tRNA (adenosine(37)-N6)-threonylcarbamoyltransferase complex dimerization subunit type 1 TsaB [Olivibacter sp. XZL3]|uniref:tRNA (adenosine(37)-N6)-threonylcarbamoyltransferase complex dimerization subunit type 1 TsaB n=1 Tax=Olivibacter sp. XZL3 TaxID=1735116 RepID=UPI0010661E47|nr:tRNA (adenosine(37)-N6)-threonylcarbamoyltransferase complex dimerization subunit type 1 TsaB [Olivibacter sp. XZL3]